MQQWRYNACLYEHLQNISSKIYKIKLITWEKTKHIVSDTIL